MPAETRKRILVVDDDDLIRENCLSILTYGGYSVDLAINGLDALNKLKSSIYDLIISDINMPQLDGLELYRCVERDHPFLKNRFLLMTGNLPTGTEIDTILSKINNKFLKKPFLPNDLLDYVENLTKFPHQRRREERHKWNANCQMVIKTHSRPLIVQIQDISGTGIKIKLPSEPILRKGDQVLVNIQQINIERKAQVMWSGKSKGSSWCGLGFTEPAPIPSAIKLIQNL